MGALTTDTEFAAATAIDTREAHKKLFSGVAPRGCEYYAGNYRGSDFRCLKHCTVGVRSDPRVGEKPHRVALRMHRISAAIKKTLTALDSEAPISTTEELHRLTTFICQSFVDFLTIHPYANGNGHAARMILCAILLRYGFQPYWKIDTHPAEPYADLITEFRNGNTEPLQRYVLQWIV